jgi:hypothetical protein
MSAKLEMLPTRGGKRVKRRASRNGIHLASAREPELNALLGRRDLLREEIKRGKECLSRVQAELAERESRLEEWPTYETQCGVDCLPHLTASVSSGSRVVQFLTGWLSRRQVELAEVDQGLSLLARRHNFGHLAPGVGGERGIRTPDTAFDRITV